jgi:hypothetical protein
MLRKKRLNTNITELDRLETGEFPTPNSGRIEHFNEFMTTVNGILGTTAEPMVLWYALIQSLGNPKLILKQLPHCQEAIITDYGEIPENIGSLLLSNVMKPHIVEISENANLDFRCLITLDDCSHNGGYKISRHQSLAGQTCCPIYVFSEQGYRQFVDGHDLLCPICYNRINPDMFEPVIPCTTNERIFSEDLTSVYSSQITSRGYISQPSNQFRPTVQVASSSQAQSNQKKILFMMEGNVGSGKSTYATMLQQKLESLGLDMTVVNESTDKYCKMGIHIKDAANRVKMALRKLSSITTEYLVVIIDTCNDRGSGRVIFDYNFSDWIVYNVRPNFDQEKIRGYLEWSLRNVLSRPMHSSTTMHYLNPVSASVDICLKVHSDKGRNLFGNRFVKVYTRTTKDQILEEINNGADAYQEYLDQDHVLDIKIAELVNKVIDQVPESTSSSSQPQVLTRTMTSR